MLDSEGNAACMTFQFTSEKLEQCVAADAIAEALKEVAAKMPKTTPAQSDLDTQLEQEAQENIRWVIQKDAGALATYEKGKVSTDGNKFRAVLLAQGHNRRAHQVITQYGEKRTVAYINSIGG